jgi:Cu/Ag efflux protein CusF
VSVLEEQMKYVRFGLVIGLAVTLLVAAGYGQQKGKKEYTFRGKVEKIDANAKTFVVNGQKVEGWMGAMTMSYQPDKADVLKNLKVGDEITAKVYDGDFKTLYDVKVVQPEKK